MNIYIFGAGENYWLYRKWFQYHNVLGVLDNLEALWGKYIDNHKIISPKKISDSQPLTVLSEEILKAIVDGNDISSEKSILIEMFNQRVSQLSSSDSGGNSKKQEYLQKQITDFFFKFRRWFIIKANSFYFRFRC